MITKSIIEAILATAPNPIEILEDGGLYIWVRPFDGEEYIVALDPSLGGLSLDPSSFQVIRKSDGMQCAEFCGYDNPTEVARIAVQAARYYNSALLAIESNGIGGSLALSIVEMEYGYPNVYATSRVDRGWRMTARTRAVAAKNLHRLIVNYGSNIFKSSRLMLELLSFYDADGNAVRTINSRDDCVVSMMIAQAVRMGVE